MDREIFVYIDIAVSSWRREAKKVSITDKVKSIAWPRPSITRI